MGGVERVALSVDVACFAIAGGVLRLLLVRRAVEPFEACWALPGGVVGEAEPLDAAARRVLAERTGVAGAYLEQLYTFGDPGRDPRSRTVSVAYYALLPVGEHPARAGRDVSAAEWWPVFELPPLAFDHDAIAAYAQQRLRQKITYAPLAFRSLPETFTMGQLRAVHEAIEGRQLHPSNFVRQMLSRWCLAPVPNALDRSTRRPAQLYRYIGSREIVGPPPRAAADARPAFGATAAPAETAVEAGTADAGSE